MEFTKSKINKYRFALTLIGAAFIAQNSKAQELVLKPNSVKGETHILKDDFPTGNLINMVEGWGGMTVAINEPKAGTDFTPILKGLKDNLCQVPHWGYLEKGKVRVIDTKNKTEVITAGEVFYMPPGHTLIVDEDARIIDFSPEKEMNELNDFILDKVAEMQNEK